MKHLANFIVEKKYWILSVMLLLCIGSACLIPQVTINSDLTVYLPDDSPVKEGLTVMAEEFPDTEMPGTIRIMFDGLPDERVPQVMEQLAAVENISAVRHEDGEDWNRGSFRLFEVTCDFPYQSPEETAAEEAILALFPDDTVVLQHSMATIDEIPVWVYGLVLVVLLVILFVMCSSYTEPFLFLFTIGAAIVINLGTNVIFDSVSETTFTLSAILQLALSMDYSIILMNRFRQGKANAESSGEAMKHAFQAAFPSIVSSGMTTVIGLVMLVFMRFKLGLDLGRVMAKGVALSMICVLTMLPALILICDPLIEKTKKKELHIPTKGLASFGFKARRVLAVVFVILFAGTFALQNLTDITYAQPKNNEIENVFPSPNPVVVLYQNQDEEALSAMLPALSEKEHVHSVFAYGNTLGRPMTAEELSSAMLLMGGTPVDPSVLSMLYYHYFQKGALPSVTLAEFMQFLSSDVLENEMFSSYIDDSMKTQLAELAPMLDRTMLSAPMNAAGLAKLFGMEEAQAQLLLVLSLAQNPEYRPAPCTLPAFAAFLPEAAKNPAFAGKIDAAALAQLTTLLPLLDKAAVTAPLPAEALAKTFGMDVQTVGQILAMSQTQTMSMYDFSSALLGAAKNPALASLFSAEALAQVGMMNTVMGLTISEKALEYEEAAAILGMEADTVRLLYTLRAETAPQMAPVDFVHFLTDVILPSGMDASLSDPQTAAQLLSARAVMDAVVSEQTFDRDALHVLLHGFSPAVTKEQTSLLLLLYGGTRCADETWKLSIADLLSYVNTTVLPDPLFASVITEEQKEGLASASAMVDTALHSLRSDNCSLALLDTTLPPESEETTAFIDTIQAELDETLEGDFYIIGNSPMNVEMEKHFRGDQLLITFLTAIAIFIVVALTFRSVSIPLILVLLVQCGVFITVAFTGLVGHSVYYLSLLIVQCILMGATIDYAIVFTNYYLDCRRTMEIREALTASFRDSIHTILTSGLIIVLITAIIGLSPADPAITEICQTLAVGTGSAILLILFVLPGLLSALDRFVVKKDKKAKKEKTEKTETASR